MRGISLVLFIAVSLSACGGGSTGPTGPTTVVPTVTPSVSNGVVTPVQPVPPQPPPPPAAPAALAITPSEVAMSVGQTVVFTATGGDGTTYSFMPVQPGYAFETVQVSYNQVRVLMFGKSDISPVVLSVDGNVNGSIKGVSALIRAK